jgi:hypothetical protein
MDFTNRGATPQPQTVHPVGVTPQTPVSLKSTQRPPVQSDGGSKIVKVGIAVFIFLTAAIVVLLSLLFFTSQPSSESGYVDTSKLQAVFLNTGQVYFGHIDKLTKNFFVLTDIYYLQTSSTGTTGATTSTTSTTSSPSSSNVSLVKLGCELHKPYDQMVINADQVTFWENLQSDGQVAKAVVAYQASNPNDTCSNTTTSTGTSVQGTSSTSTTTPTSSTTTTTK